MVGSHPASRYGRRLLRGRPNQWLGIQIWHPHHHHFGQGSPIHLRHLERSLQQAQHNDGIPPSKQRPSGEGPQAVEGGPEEQTGGRPAWPDHLPWVLLGLRAAPKDDSNISPAELVYRAPLVVPDEFVDAMEPPAADFLEHMRATPTSIPTRPLPPPPSPSGPQNNCYRPAGYTCSEAGCRRRWSTGSRPSS